MSLPDASIAKVFCFFFSKKKVFLLLPLAACGTLPQPFYGNPGKTAQQLAIPPAPDLIIPTPDSALLPTDSAKLYATDLATALADQDVPSLARPATATDWRILTSASLAGTIVTPHYVLAGPDGKTYGTLAGAPVPAEAWSNAAPTTLAAQANADALSLLAVLKTANAQVQGSNPNSLENRPARLYIAGVTGAPGDGNQSLALNLARDLPQLGLIITTNQAAADFTINAEVSTKPDSNNQLLVQLNWMVHDSYKRKIGQVTQLHDLAPTDMTPYWGDTAAAAATEAAAGIQTVINNATLHRDGGLK